MEYTENIFLSELIGSPISGDAILDLLLTSVKELMTSGLEATWAVVIMLWFSSHSGEILDH